MTTTRLPLLRDWLACSAWSRQTTTVKNDGSWDHPNRSTLGVFELPPVRLWQISGKRP
jgi:hypothetical protein